MSAECRRDSNAFNPVTVCIGLIGFFLLFQAWEAGRILAPALAGDLASWSGRGQRRWALLWRLVLPFLLLPLLGRRRWAWASVHGVLQVYVITGLLSAGVTVVAMARRASVLPGGIWGQVTTDLVWLPALGYWLGLALLPLPLCLAFRRLAPEFGLDPRKAWLSLAREGGPAILITAVLECIRLGPVLGRPF